jgi:hypothetical protein
VPLLSPPGRLSPLAVPPTPQVAFRLRASLVVFKLRQLWKKMSTELHALQGFSEEHRFHHTMLESTGNVMETQLERLMQVVLDPQNVPAEEITSPQGAGRDGPLPRQMALVTVQEGMELKGLPEHSHYIELFSSAVEKLEVSLP